MRQFLFLLGITTCLAGSVQAGLSEGLLAYQHKQYPLAFDEFTALSNEGDPIAHYYLGKLYQEGLGVSKNLTKAHALFQQADAGYYFPASAALGKMLLSGENQIPAEPMKGLALLKKAAYAGETDALFELGQAYAHGKDVETNLNYAYGYYLIAALKGHMKAQYALGKLYFEGRGIPQDYSAALKWFARSANQGYVLAQVSLADIRMTNPRLKNAAEAYGWYSIIAGYNLDEIGQKAIEKRDALAAGLDAKVLADRQEKNSRWKPISAEESVPMKEKEETTIPTIPGFNDVQSLQDFLVTEGYLLRDGQRFGITTQMVDMAIAKQNADDLTLAIEKAARQGKREAFGYYGDLYKTRLNNLAEAFVWYKKGAEAGDLYAEYQLAKMYCEGSGIQQPDASSCYAWLRLAQAGKSPILNGVVQNALSVVHENATSEELENGEKIFATLQSSPAEKQDEKGMGFSFF